MAVKGTSTVTLTRVVDGTNGTNGTNGVSVTKMDQYYLATTASSGVTTSTSGWTTTFQAITSSKRYLWGYQKYTYSNSTTTTTTPAIIGVYGDTGGAGATGKGVSSVTTYFLVNSSNSGVTTSTSGWTTTLQTTSETNRYLWQYEKYQYTDNTSTNTTPRIVSTHGASGKDAITISITPEWSGSTCTLTANVFMGGRQLSDTEILALGCLKWYEGTTFVANGKQLTRTVSTKQVVECRLESGGGGLMPEFITLADGSLAVKGRNLAHGCLYTESSPYLHTSSAKDGCAVIKNIYCEFPSPGMCTLSFRTDKTMGNAHAPDGTAGNIIDPTFWIYFYNSVAQVGTWKFNTALLVKTLKQAEDGRWYALVNVSETYPYCSFRFNTYSDGTIVQTAKVWDISLTYGSELLPYSPAPEDEEVSA